MRYYAQYSNGNLIAIGTGNGGNEIYEEEYNRLSAEIQQKADLVDKLFLGEITIDDIPEEWREEIQRRVDERKVMEAESMTDEITPDELMTMMEGLL